jgi:hypothetical protein
LHRKSTEDEEYQNDRDSSDCDTKLGGISLEDNNEQLHSYTTEKEKVELEQTDHDLIPLIHGLHLGVSSNDVEDGPTASQESQRCLDAVYRGGRWRANSPEFTVQLLDEEEHDKPRCTNDAGRRNEERLYFHP